MAAGGPGADDPGRPARLPANLAHRRHPGDEPVMLTEFGGINFAIDEDRPNWGYSSAQDVGSFLAAYDELVSAVLESTHLAGFCYTQLTDTMQETNGLLTENREPKFDIAAIHAINTRPSRSMPGEAVRAAQKKVEIIAPGAEFR